MKLTETQKQLLFLMKRGYIPVIYRDDPRTCYKRAGDILGFRGNAHTVLALLKRGFIEVHHSEPDRNSSDNGKWIGGSTSYRLTDKGRGS